MQPVRFDLSEVTVLPLAERVSLTRVEDVVVDPESEPPPVTEEVEGMVAECADRVRQARDRGASVMLIYGAHLLRNGAALILERLMAGGWISHLATNGAGSIHDWEYAHLGRSTESVAANVATGTFGTWDETGRNIHLALLSGGVSGEGYGGALGRFIQEEGTELPSADELRRHVQVGAVDELAVARLELLRAMERHGLAAGRHTVAHRWKAFSIFAQAYRHGVPLTVHPGIGYDIISTHPMFNGGAIGRAAQWDFLGFAQAVEGLDGGVVMSIGSAIMGPQVFEKALSCVNNVRLHKRGRQAVSGHSIYVVDLQEGGNWDWSRGEPPKDNPAYYLRFCKSYSRMGGRMRYACYDNAAFVHHLWKRLR